MKVTRIAGRQIKNATKPLIITVKPCDVKEANIKEPSQCVMARAILRQEHTEARVHISRIYVKSKDGYWYRYGVPESLRSEIIAFDRGGAFLPDTFEVMPLRKSHRATGKAKGSETNKTRNRKLHKPRKKHVYVKDIRTGPANGV